MLFTFSWNTPTLSTLRQIHPSIVSWDHCSLQWFHPPVAFDCTFQSAINHELPCDIAHILQPNSFKLFTFTVRTLALVLILSWIKGKWEVRGQTNGLWGMRILPFLYTHHYSSTTLLYVLFINGSSNYVNIDIKSSWGHWKWSHEFWGAKPSNKWVKVN